MHRWLYTWGKTGVAQNKTFRRHAEDMQKTCRRNAESGKVMKTCGQMIRWKSREVPSNDRLRSTQGYWIQMNTDGYRWIEDPAKRLLFPFRSFHVSFQCLDRHFDQILSEVLMGRAAQTLSFGAWVLLQHWFILVSGLFFFHLKAQSRWHFLLFTSDTDMISKIFCFLL